MKNISTKSAQQGLPGMLVAALILILPSYGCNEAGFAGGSSAAKDERRKERNDADAEKDQDRDEHKAEQDNSEDLLGETDESSADSTDETDADETAEDVAKDIVFGSDQAFHIGDGDFGHSSCLTTLNQHALAGLAWFFEFEVLEDDTRVDIMIKSVCGNDNIEGNQLRVSDGARNLHEQTVPALVAQLTVPSLVLSRGRHKVWIESGFEGFSATTGEPMAGYDDFMVNGVTIHADKDVRKLEIGAR